MQQKPNTKLQDILKSKKAKTRKLSELSKTEQNRLAKLNEMLDELKRYEDKQKRQFLITAEQKATAQKENTAQPRNFTIAARACTKVTFARRR